MRDLEDDQACRRKAQSFNFRWGRDNRNVDYKGRRYKEGDVEVFEEDVSDSKAQFAAITLMIGVLRDLQGLSEEASIPLPPPALVFPQFRQLVP